MGKKKKIKLTAEQKQWFANLQWYLDNKICWHGDQDLKEVVQNGRYAVLSTRQSDKWDYFNCVICCDTVENANAIIKYNPDAVFRLIDLSTLMTLKEIINCSRPDFKNYVEMLESKDE